MVDELDDDVARGFLTAAELEARVQEAVAQAERSIRKAATALEVVNARLLEVQGLDETLEVLEHALRTMDQCELARVLEQRQAQMHSAWVGVAWGLAGLLLLGVAFWLGQQAGR